MSVGMPGRIARGFVKYILPLIVIFAAVQGAKKIIASRPEPQRQETEDRGVLVDVQTVHQTSQRFDVLAQGTVVPSRQMVLQPQVTGRVVWQNDELVLGGVLHEDDEVIRIERADYRLQVNIARGELERARVGLELEEGRGLIAEREWNLFQDDLPHSERGRSLALREPQQREATQMVELAENRVSQARLGLDRTEVTAPFNGYVQNEMVEVSFTGDVNDVNFVRKDKALCFCLLDESLFRLVEEIPATFLEREPHDVGVNAPMLREPLQYVPRLADVKQSIRKPQEIDATPGFRFAK